MSIESKRFDADASATASAPVPACSGRVTVSGGGGRKWAAGRYRSLLRSPRASARPIAGTGTHNTTHTRLGFARVMRTRACAPHTHANESRAHSQEHKHARRNTHARTRTAVRMSGTNADVPPLFGSAARPAGLLYLISDSLFAAPPEAHRQNGPRDMHEQPVMPLVVRGVFVNCARNLNEPNARR